MKPSALKCSLTRVVGHGDRPSFLKRALAVPRLRNLVAVTIGCACVTVTPAIELRDGDTIAICGDSITEQRIYSVLIENYLTLCQPHQNVSVRQIGWSGEAARAFASRIESDVLPFEPTVVTTFYGMNDGGYRAPNEATNAAYRETTAGYITTLLASGVRTVLTGSPGVVDSDAFKAVRLARCSPEEYNETLRQLGAAARAAVRDTGTEFVDVYGPMLETMRKMKAKLGTTYVIARDGVHPGYDGHLLIAAAFLAALGCDGEIGRLSLDMASGHAVVSTGHRVVQASRASIEVESSRYPFCFIDDSGNVAFPQDLLEQFPFNERLNRFLLVVTNLPTTRASVRWGLASKEFSREELEQGVNLAAEFPDNPFVRDFAKVDAAVRAKQEYETAASKVLLHGLPEWQARFPDRADLFAELKQAVIERAKELDRAAKGLRVPVLHKVEIVPRVDGGAEDEPGRLE